MASPANASRLRVAVVGSGIILAVVLANAMVSPSATRLPSASMFTNCTFTSPRSTEDSVGI